MNKFFHPLFALYRCLAVPVLGAILSLTVIACEERTPTAQQTPQNPPAPVQDVERDLTFNDVTLEQSDEQGRPVWKVKAKQATYSKDRKVAQVASPNGELFQDGKPVYYITAQTGEIEQDGQRLFLRGQIVAKAPRYDLVLRGNELEWQPKADLLIVRNKLTGSNPQVQVVAQEARVKSRAGLIELFGQVQATSKDPNLQMRTEHAIWRIREQKLIADRPLEIDRYQDRKITDRGKANRGEVNLKTKIATLQQNAQLFLLQPPIDVASDLLTWNMNTEVVTSNRPVKVVQRQQQMTVTAKQGKMDLKKEVAYLNGDVNGVGQRGQALQSKELTWYISNQNMEANGNVLYRQANPSASFKGEKAVGNLEKQNIVVSGDRVLTEIVPQDNLKTP